MKSDTKLNIPYSVHPEIAGIEGLHNLINETYSKVMVERMGSFEGQVDACDRISKMIENRLFDNGWKPVNFCFEEEIDNVGIVRFNVSVEDRLPNGFEVMGSKDVESDGSFSIDLRISSSLRNVPNISATIAHELMHCFQQTLERVDGVSENSMITYMLSIDAFHSAPDLFSYMFFYGLYLCHSIETKANVSCVANYLRSIFDGKESEVRTIDIQKALMYCDQYNSYVRILSFTEKPVVTGKGLEYIKRIMTGMVRNPYNGQFVRLYETDKFDVDKFVKSNIRTMNGICKKTIDKMLKNTALWK